MAPGLIDEVVVTAINRAVQRVLREGVQVMALSHLTKTASGASLVSVAGSGNLSNNAGTVLTLSGKPGATRLELSLEKPAGPPLPGPLRIEHDHATGRSRLVGAAGTNDDREAVLQAVRSAPGLGVASYAALTGLNKQAARRHLNALSSANILQHTPGRRGGSGGSSGGTFRPVDGT
jgi:hypothetical protein